MILYNNLSDSEMAYKDTNMLIEIMFKLFIMVNGLFGSGNSY